MSAFPGGMGGAGAMGPFIQMLLLGYQLGQGGQGGRGRRTQQQQPGPMPVPPGAAMNPGAVPLAGMTVGSGGPMPAPVGGGMALNPGAAPLMPPPMPAPGMPPAPTPVPVPPAGVGGAPPPGVGAGLQPMAGATFKGPPPPGFQSWEEWYGSLPPAGKLQYRNDYLNYLMGGGADQTPPGTPLTPP